MKKSLFSAAGRIFSIVSLVSVANLAAPMASFAQFNNARPVETAIAEKQTLARQITVQGRVRSGRPYEISAPLSAVTEIEPLRAGDFVVQGQKLATQKSDVLRTQRQRTQLKLTETQQNQQQAQTDLTFRLKLAELAQDKMELLRQKAERAQSLVNRGTLSAEAYESVQTSLLATEEQLVARQQAVSQLHAQLDMFTITIQQLQLDLDELDRDIRSATLTAPISGQLINLIEGNNRFLREGDNIVQIRNQKDFEIEAQIPAEYISFVEQAGMLQASYDNPASKTSAPARLQIDLIFRATLPVENSRTGTRNVRFIIEDDLPPVLQADNTPVTVYVPSSPPQSVVTIPQDALIPVSDGHIVFVVTQDSQAKRRIITLGGIDGNKVIVTNGLAAGDKVVTKGNEGLSDGSKVRLPGAPPSKRGSGNK